MRHEWQDERWRYAIQEEYGKPALRARKLGESLWRDTDIWHGGPYLAPEVLRLAAALRALAKPLTELISGTLEGEADAGDILEKAGLVRWETYDRDNDEQTSFLADNGLYEIEDGDRFWRLTDFGEEVLVDH